MRRLVWDVESDGLLDTITKIHCIAVTDADSGEEWFFGPDTLHDAQAVLDMADVLIGHNSTAFDHAAVRQILGWVPKPHQRVRDTLVMARLAYPDRERDDQKDSRRAVQCLNGGHSLDDWGVRLGCKKIKYTGGFEKYTEAMKSYVIQDTKVCAALWKHLLTLKLPEDAVVLEHRFAIEMERLSSRGFTIDPGALQSLTEALERGCQEAESKVREIIPATVEEMKTPEYWEATWPDGTTSRFLTKGEADLQRKLLKVKPKQWTIAPGPMAKKLHPFNCNSRKQIREYLKQRHNWVSPKLTDKGEELLKAGKEFDELAAEYGSVSEDILRSSGVPEASTMADFLMTKKRLGQVRDGKKAWTKLLKADGKIHHRVIHIGAATCRCAHSGPNLGQVPAVSVDKETGKPKLGIQGRFGWECRACFVPSPGYVLVGTDLSGIEARMLAHFLYPFDGGAYIRQVLEGDIHQLNVEAFRKYAGYSVSRGDSKTPYYALVYGVGDLKQGRYFVEHCTEARDEFFQRQKYYNRHPDRVKRVHYVAGKKVPYRPVEQAYADIGKKAKNALEQGIDGYQDLKARVQNDSEEGRLWVFDRYLPVRAKHSALNTVFQGGGAIVMKRWTVETFDQCRRERLNAHLLANIHDENQAEVWPTNVERYKEISLTQIAKAGEHFKMHIPLTGESKVGYSWAETH